MAPPCVPVGAPCAVSYTFFRGADICGWDIFPPARSDRPRAVGQLILPRGRGWRGRRTGPRPFLPLACSPGMPGPDWLLGTEAQE